MRKNERRRRVEKYAKQSISYFQNALKAIENRENEKTGEFLWGAVAEIMKAAGASKNIRLKSHTDLWNYARRLSKELEDESIYDIFSMANHLHSNFYEAELATEDIIASMERIHILLQKMWKLLGLKISVEESK